jgi:hypothetical protein
MNPSPPISNQQRLKEQKEVVRFGSTAIEDKQPGFRYTHGTVEQQIAAICFKCDTRFVSQGKTITVDPTVTCQTVSSIPCYDVVTTTNKQQQQSSSSSSSSSSSDQYMPEDRSDLV